MIRITRLYCSARGLQLHVQPDVRVSMNLVVDRISIAVSMWHAAGSNWCRDHLGCAHHCHSTALGTRCICRRGFRLHPNGKDCIGIYLSIRCVLSQIHAVSRPL